MNPPPERTPWLAVAGVMVVLFLSALDGTIVGTAMPAVTRAIGGVALYPWAFSAFILASTVTTPFFGKLADAVGVRRGLFGAVAIFLAGSAACGAAWTMPGLIAARVVQGIGAGGISTLTFVSMGTLFPPEKRGRAQGLVAMVWGVSTLLGPLAGGVIVASVSWSWIFWINLPAGLVALGFLAAYPADPAPPRRPAIAALDAVLLAGGLTAVMVALSDFGPATGAAGLGGLAAVAWFVRRQAVSPDPLVPLDPFRRRLWAGAAALGFLTCATMFTALTYVPVLLQSVWGRSAPEAGAAITPMMFAWPVSGAIAGAVVNRLGFRANVVLGAALMLVGYGLLAFGPAGSATLVALYGVPLACGMGFVTATTLVAAQAGVPRRQLGTASSTMALVRNVAAALGVAVLGGVQWLGFQAGLAARGVALDPAQAAAMLAGPSRADGMVAAVREAMAGSLHLTFTGCMALAVVALVVACLLPPISPAEASRQAEEAA